MVCLGHVATARIPTRNAPSENGKNRDNFYLKSVKDFDAKKRPKNKLISHTEQIYAKSHHDFNWIL